jgi:hypothetical protein
VHKPLKENALYDVEPVVIDGKESKVIPVKT